MTEDRPRDEPDEPHDDRSDDRRDAPSDDPFEDDRSEPADEAADVDARSNVGGWLGTVLDALDRLDRATASGSRRTGRKRLDYDVSIGSLEDATRERAGRDPVGRGRDADRDRDRDRDRKRTRRAVRSPSSEQVPVATDRRDDELLVTADVAGVDREDVTVGFADGALVVAVEGSELERVSVPWDDPTAEATVKNGVLTVIVEPSDGGGDDSGGGPDE